VSRSQDAYQGGMESSCQGMMEGVGPSRQGGGDVCRVESRGRSNEQTLQHLEGPQSKRHQLEQLQSERNWSQLKGDQLERDRPHSERHEFKAPQSGRDRNRPHSERHEFKTQSERPEDWERPHSERHEFKAPQSGRPEDWERPRSERHEFKAPRSGRPEDWERPRSERHEFKAPRSGRPEDWERPRSERHEFKAPQSGRPEDWERPRSERHEFKMQSGRDKDWERPRSERHEFQPERDRRQQALPQTRSQSDWALQTPDNAHRHNLRPAQSSNAIQYPPTVTSGGYSDPMPPSSKVCSMATLENERYSLEGINRPDHDNEDRHFASEGRNYQVSTTITLALNL
jgi:hypothetical protein